jgi:large subunit ribosomal protein L4e
VVAEPTDPKVEKDWSRKLNQKERQAARNSALAATVSMETVSARGHRFDEEVEHLPIVLGNYSEIVDGKTTEYDIESFNHGSATRKAAAIFDQLGLGPDLDRARNGPQDSCWKGNNAWTSSQNS